MQIVRYSHGFQGPSFYRYSSLIKTNRLSPNLNDNLNSKLSRDFSNSSRNNNNPNNNWSQGPKQMGRMMGSDWKLFRATMKGEITKFVNTYPYLSTFAAVSLIISGNVALMIFGIFSMIMYMW